MSIVATKMGDPLMIAARNNKLDIIRLLLAKNANPNIRTGNHSPLYLASRKGFGCIEMLNELYRHGALLDSLDEDGATALMKTAKWGFVDALEFLVSKGASTNLKDKDGKTALIFATFANQDDSASIITRLLSAPGINALLEDNEGMSVLKWVKGLEARREIKGYRDPKNLAYTYRSSAECCSLTFVFSLDMAVFPKPDYKKQAFLWMYASILQGLSIIKVQVGNLRDNANK